MTRDERDRFADLFHRLMHTEQASDEGADRDSALRLLSHSLLNFLGTEGTDATDELCDALPWLAAFLDWTRGEADPAQMAGHLEATPVVRTLSPAMIERRLSAHPVAGEEPVSRAPAMWGSDDAHVEIMAVLADTERSLGELVGLSEDELRARLIGDSGVLAAALELCEDAWQNALSERLRRAFATWRYGDAQPTERRRSEALWILAGLEAGDDTRNPLSEDGFELSKRSRGFERGLAQNMERVQLITAVRAALAFGAVPGEACELADADAREAFLRQFDVFRADAALMQLASALMEVRGVCIDYVCGGAPLSCLSPWIAYLRGACVELAEVRECTLREAMSYAHYCLHLVNVCDFAAMGPQAFNEETREALSHLEEELKEFALAGQREGLSDADADLARFQNARWRRAGDAAYLADRLSRLRGAWRKGMSPGPMGAPPRLDADVTAHSLALIESLVGESSEAEISALARLVEHARLRDLLWLEHLEPSHILKILAISVTAARDLPGVDICRPFEVDLGGLGRFATDPERGRLNRRILAALLDRREMAEILNGAGEHSALRRGIVGHVAGDGRLMMQFVADPELEALLELLVTTTAEDAEFAAVLERRLASMLQRHEPSRAADSDVAEVAARDATDARLV